MKRYVADGMTLGNGLAGVAALTLLARDPTSLGPVLGLVALGVALDALDGPVARRLGSTGLGDALDATCDAISFVALPAVLIALLAPGPLGWAAAAVVALAGLLRLALNEQVAGGFFRGVPTPWSAATLGALVLTRADPLVLTLGAVVLGLLNVAPFPTPRSLGRFTPLAVLLGLVALGVGGALVAGSPLGLLRWAPLVLAVGVVGGALVTGSLQARKA